MDSSPIDRSTDESASGSSADTLIRRFVEHWGVMARAWGINSTMGELFALLYITGADWTAEDLRARLDVSRGNVSMNLRELMGWGVVRKVHRPGERRELYRAEADVWTLFQRIMAERKRRELDPTVRVLDDLAAAAEVDSKLRELQGRVETLRNLLGAIDGLSTRLMRLDSGDLVEIGRLLSDDIDDGPI
ncbi:GbsR/MarR family transcriptional regulator [Paludisphaera soli]|uniref:GbsR/MarR family transcriptional regulator n=1 Tax=Paludisphaera soli TaxID=2712865 RepID=UPI0013EA0010|nr:MarR family transcriptional regulator [Paludisphaera soli]